MASTDRRLIADFMVPFFPTMADTDEYRFTSDDWHGFLNAQTGLDIDPSEPNSTAFDKWRQAIAQQQDLPVWGYTQKQIQAIEARGVELKKAEDARVAALPAILETLALMAPTKTAQQLIDDTTAA